MSAPAGAALLWGVLANVVGGSTYVLMDEAARGLPDLFITWLRVVISLVLFAGFGALARRPRERFTAREHALLFVVGVPGYAVPCLLGLLGVQWASAGHGAMLVLLEPLAIVPLSLLLLGERPPGRRLVAVAIGAVGTLIVVTDGQGPAALALDTALWGKVVLAAQGVFWALFSVAAKPLLRRHSSWSVSTGALAYAAVPLTVITVLEIPGLRPAALDGVASSLGLRELVSGPALGAALAATAALAVVGSFLGTLLWNMGLKGLPATTMAALIFVQPVVGVLLDALASSRWPSGIAMLGTAVILAGVLLCGRAPRRPMSPVPAPEPPP